MSITRIYLKIWAARVTWRVLVSFSENSEKRFQAEIRMMKMKDMLQWSGLGQYGAERATVQWEAMQIPNAECEHLTVV